MIPSNSFLRSTILAGQTVQRLRREGISLEHAKQSVAQIINTEEAEMNRLRRPFNEMRFVEQLNRLPGIEEESGE